MDWNGRPVLVTGATGLLGGALVESLLSRGASVIALVRDRVAFSRFYTEGLRDQVVTVRGDVVDQHAMERILGEHEVRSVFHLAAQTIVGIANRNPVSTFESNIRGTWSMLEACRRSVLVSEIVLASSDKAYGEQEVLPYRESAPLQGRAPYDVSKSCADLIAQSYARTYDLPVCITRCGNFFGEGDLNWNRLIPGTMRDLLAGRSPLIRSDGSFVRDYIHVDDGAAAYLHTAEALNQRRELAGSGFNFSLETPLTVLEMLARITAAVGVDIAPTILGEATHEIPAQYLDSSLAREQLGWEPTIGLDDGLKRTAEWYRIHLKEAR